MPGSGLDVLIEHVVGPEVGVEQPRVRHDVHNTHVLLHRVRYGVDVVNAGLVNCGGIRHRISVTAQRRQCEHTYQARPKRIHRALDLSMVVHWLLGGPPPPGSSCGPPRPNRSRLAMKTPSATATLETSKIVRFLENRRS